MMKEVRGVIKVVSGYTGGEGANPTYEQVSSGSTGHAEAIQIEFDPAAITYEQLVELFFLTHDPTTLNRQGNDVGTQYRSAIFYADEGQRASAEKIKAKIELEHIYDQPIVTEIVPLKEFHPAEVYHQDYFAKNPEQAYCQAVINPKVAKFRHKFSSLLKTA